MTRVWSIVDDGDPTTYGWRVEEPPLLQPRAGVGTLTACELTSVDVTLVGGGGGGALPDAPAAAGASPTASRCDDWGYGGAAGEIVVAEAVPVARGAAFIIELGRGGPLLAPQQKHGWFGWRDPTPPPGGATRVVLPDKKNLVAVGGLSATSGTTFSDYGTGGVRMPTQSFYSRVVRVPEITPPLYLFGAGGRGRLAATPGNHGAVAIAYALPLPTITVLHDDTNNEAGGGYPAPHPVSVTVESDATDRVEIFWFGNVLARVALDQPPGAAKATTRVSATRFVYKSPGCYAPVVRVVGKNCTAICSLPPFTVRGGTVRRHGSIVTAPRSHNAKG
jgi:hypothetical protein